MKRIFLALKNNDLGGNMELGFALSEYFKGQGFTGSVSGDELAQYSKPETKEQVRISRCWKPERGYAVDIEVEEKDIKRHKEALAKIFQGQGYGVQDTETS